jgi:hypothetical protein
MESKVLGIIAQNFFLLGCSEPRVLFAWCYEELGLTSVDSARQRCRCEVPLSRDNFALAELFLNKANIFQKWSNKSRSGSLLPGTVC